MKDNKIKQIELATIENDVSFVTIGFGITSNPNDLEIKPNSTGSESKTKDH